jgi:transcriptional regulator with XRE-family HTH domain
MPRTLRKPELSRRRSTGLDVREDVGKRIRTHREDSNLSLREFARRLGISASAVSQIETGKSRPSVNTLYAVIDELGLSVDDLFSPLGPAGVPPRPVGSPAREPTTRQLTGLDVREDVGKRIRTHREDSNLSLREFARRLGISPSAVSQIETGKSRPSVNTLYAVIDELGLSFDDLVSPLGPAGVPAPPSSRPAHATPVDNASVQRVEGRAAIELESGVRWERLTPGVDGEVDFLDVVYEVGGSSSHDGRLLRHPGREYGVVIAGTIEVALGFETHTLRPGDSIRFDATVPHLVRNVGDEPAECIWCMIGRHTGRGETGERDLSTAGL